MVSFFKIKNIKAAHIFCTVTIFACTFLTASAAETANSSNTFTVTPQIENNVKAFPGGKLVPVPPTIVVSSTTPEVFLNGSVGTTTSVLPAGTTNCFDYYKFGSVAVTLGTRSDIKPGSETTFYAIVKNNNPYPLVGGSIYVRVLRKQNPSVDMVNGGNIIDQFVAVDNITLDANEQKTVTFSYKVPSSVISGSYKIVPYFETQKRYNLLGLSFTDDITGLPYEFSLTGESTGIFFDKNNIKLNDKLYSVISSAPNIPSANDGVINLNIVNNTSGDITVPVTYKVYYWDGLMDSHLLATDKKNVTLKAKSTTPLTYTVTDKKNSVYYVIAEADYKDVKSIVNVRFVRNDVAGIRINFPSLLSFPIKKDAEATIFSCFHATTPAKVDNGRLSLTLKDVSTGDVIDQYDFKGPISGSMMGAKHSFIPKKNYDKISLDASLYNNNVLVDKTSVVYDCSAINPRVCEPIPEKDTSTFSGRTLAMIIGGVVLVLLLAFISRIWHQKN